MEVERHPEAPIKASGTATREGDVPFSTPFSAKIINAPRYGKVKMPTMDLYDGTTDPEEHQGFIKHRCTSKTWTTQRTPDISPLP